MFQKSTKLFQNSFVDTSVCALDKFCYTWHDLITEIMLLKLVVALDEKVKSCLKDGMIAKTIRHVFEWSWEEKYLDLTLVYLKPFSI